MTAQNNKMKVLAVDDNRTNLHILQVFLKKLGHEVILAENGEEAVQKFVSESPDLVLLDIMMPVMDGFEAARQIKAMCHDQWKPIILLTAKSDGADRIRGLEAGADDYLTKPFEPRELLLRLNNLLKRRPLPEAPLIRDEIRFGRFLFNAKREELCDDGTPIRLTERERQLLGQFAGSPDGTLSREALVGESGDVGERTIDVQINRLRRKIEDDPSNPMFLQTVRGVGYRLRFE